MGRLVECIDLLRRAFPGCTVILVHHANKQGGIRGSTVLIGAADFEYVCVKKRSLEVALECRKMKDAEMPPPLQLLGEVVNICEVMDDAMPRASTSLAFRIGVHEVQEELVIDDEVVAAVLTLTGRGEFASGASIAKEIGKRKQDVLEAIKRLTDAGKLVRATDRATLRATGYDHLY